MDAMQEFRVQTSSFAPEFGRTPGGRISIVARSGTNAFHGTLFHYFRNDNGKTICEGVVEVFTLHGHPSANTAYAWSHATDDPANPKRHVTVLHIPPAVSPLTAVRCAILQQLVANATGEAEA